MPDNKISIGLWRSQNTALREAISILEQHDWWGFATSLKEILAARESAEQEQ